MVLHKLLMVGVSVAFQSIPSLLRTPLVPTWSRAQLVFVSMAVPVTPTVPMAKNVAQMVVGAPVCSRSVSPITTCQASSVHTFKHSSMQPGGHCWVPMSHSVTVMVTTPLCSVTKGSAGVHTHRQVCLSPASMGEESDQDVLVSDTGMIN